MSTFDISHHPDGWTCIIILMNSTQTRHWTPKSIPYLFYCFAQLTFFRVIHITLKIKVLIHRTIKFNTRRFLKKEFKTSRTRTKPRPNRIRTMVFQSALWLRLKASSFIVPFVPFLQRKAEENRERERERRNSNWEEKSLTDLGKH